MKQTEETPEWIKVPETTSTNSYLRQILSERKLPEGSVVVTDFQTAGRGQIGNTWESEKEKNLTFSAILYPEVIPANRQFLISQIAALSVKETLDLYTDHISIKWPNDIYWKEKKIGGMLIENDLMGQHIYCSILGIGINLNQEHFHSNAPNPVSLRQITGKEYTVEKVLEQFLQLFYHYYLLLLQDETAFIQRKYMNSLFRKEGIHSYRDTEKNEVFTASIKEIEPTGHLLLELPDKTVRRYAFKEVSYIL